MNLAEEIRSRVNAGKSIDPMASLILDAVVAPSFAEDVLYESKKLVAIHRGTCDFSLRFNSCSRCHDVACQVYRLARACEIYEYELSSAHARRMAIEGARA